MQTISIIKGDQDNWLNYGQTIYNETTSAWETISVNHFGYFIGYHVPDEPREPVPEPTSLVLFGAGIAGLLGSRLIKKNSP